VRQFESASFSVGTEVIQTVMKVCKWKDELVFRRKMSVWCVTSEDVLNCVCLYAHCGSVLTPPTVS
jgi:hypothetical protein